MQISSRELYFGFLFQRQNTRDARNTWPRRGKFGFPGFLWQTSVWGYEPHVSSNVSHVRRGAQLKERCFWSGLARTLCAIRGTVVVLTHSEPSGTAARMMSPVTRPSAPWSPTWNRDTGQEHASHTHNPRVRSPTETKTWIQPSPTPPLACCSISVRNECHEWNGDKIWNCWQGERGACAPYPAVCWLVLKRIFTSSWMYFTRLRALKKSWQNERTQVRKL